MSKDFEDVQFDKFPQYVPGDTGLRDVYAAREYSEAAPVVSRDLWKSLVDAMEEDGGGAERLVVEVKDQKNEGSCFPPGTLVTMASGEVRPIEDVRPLDMVWTAENHLGEVRNVMARPYIGQLINVCLHGNNLVRATPEHPFLTKRGYVKAAELTTDDLVAIPKVRPAVVGVIQTAEHMPYGHRAKNETRTRHFNAPEGRKTTCLQQTRVPDVIKLDEKFGRIIGLFLAEGNTCKQKITWTFNVNEVDTLVAELQTLLREKLGVESRVRIAGTRHTAKVEMYGTLWARVFESLCANGSGHKRLCADLASGPPEFLRGVFTGWMAGDGHKRRKGQTGVTISRQLAVQMFQIANTLGMVPALCRSEPSANKHAKTRQPRYDLTVSDQPSDKNYRRQQDESHVWRLVRDLASEDYKGHVYNLHVHGDESYIADGLGVHNCVGAAGTQAMQVLQAREVGKDRVVKLSAISLYQLIGRSPNSGASVNDCLDELVKTGVIPLDTPENRAVFGDVVMPATGFYSKRPAGWQEVAAKFRLTEWWEVKGEEQLITALLNQHPVVVGRDGHSICYLRPMYRNGQLGVLYVNSWGDWGMPAAGHPSGFGWDSLSKVRSSARWAFALTA